MDQQPTQPGQPKPSNSIWKVLVAIALIGIPGGIIAYMTKKPEVVPGETMTNDGMTSTPTPVAESSEYKDGTYEVDGEYLSPGGPELMGVTITLANGIITDTSVEVKTARPISKMMQEAFQANYKPLVVGKSIDDVMLDKVSGASLSPKGFNDAVVKIKAEAKA